MANRDELSLTYVKFEAGFPPIERFTAANLAEFNLALCQRHSFEGYHVSGDSGAHFYTESLRDIELERGRIELSESASARRTIDVLKRDFGDIVEITQKQFGMPVFVQPDYTMRAIWPMAADLGDKVTAALGLHADQMKLLGVETDGTGLIVFCTENPESETAHHQIKIQPSLTNTEELFVEVNSHVHQIVETPAVIEQGMQRVYDYLMGPTADFIESLRLDGGTANG